MKKAKIFISTLVISLSITISGFAQEATGMLLNAFAFTTADMYLYSQRNGSFGTARSAAMGGAFTSLGGDLAASGINPAGLGMYRSSVYSFSPSYTTSKARNANGYYSDNENKFAFNNIGAVFTTTYKSDGIVSFNFGISYNKIADLDNVVNATLPTATSSLNHIFALQLNGLGNSWNGITKRTLDNYPFQSESIDIGKWGAVSAYQSGKIITPLSNDPYNSDYVVSGLSDGTRVTPSIYYESAGSIGEYDISSGLNINNFLYLGLGVSIQNISHVQYINYTEKYELGSGTPQTSPRQMDYDQQIESRGGGVNFKFGAILRPIKDLRIGVALHTPTYSTITHSYNSTMYTQLYGIGSGIGAATSPVNTYDYSFTTPMRLLTGVSYAFNNRAIVSLDYEMAYYNNMHSRNSIYDSYLNNEINNTYTTSNNLRLGVEFKVSPDFALRAGYNYIGSPFKKDNAIRTRIMAIASEGISAGLGYSLGKYSTLDIAYIFTHTKYADVELFYYTGTGKKVDTDGNITFVEYKENADINNPLVREDYPITTKDWIRNLHQNRHIFTISLNYMF